MAIQTTYPASPAASMPGMIVDTVNHDIISKSVGGAAVIPFGRFVTHESGQADVKVVLPAAAGDVTGEAQGFAVCDTARQSAVGGGSAGYAVNDTIAVLRKGRIYVEAIDAVTALNAQVYVVHAAGVNQGKVAFASASGAALKGARFVQTSAAAGIVAIEYAPENV